MERFCERILMPPSDLTGPEDVLIVRIPAAAPRSATNAERGPDPRVARTRMAVAEAATTLFLRNGYQGTSVDDIASLARVSKRSVYNNFGDKDTLFTEIVLGYTATAQDFADRLVAGLPDATDVPTAIRELARRHLAAVAQPQVLRLRRLIILEATRFPELAAEYYRRAPGRVMNALTEAFGELHARGALNTPDPKRAAEHFSYLVLGATLDTALFDPDGPMPSPRELQRIADDGADAFLAAYRPS
ncbi:TetR/AcrR family transcriptional regulator [Amycolatopsis thermophila]|uniref:TetR/AcrR family transcriptional repressor of mexJK operon n=1 Tax=Amycolatopsis thermophila TaxID=206084 RepID=A0ABU0F344_9PSEU|nr:TetR/AcrR family transcriptional regulator [Amycolatopsis thermophila]MDQ0381505.1 TetR/AcrR family transcriptional repressor of mexJK operon [Amycolatopsis thermophila]